MFFRSRFGSVASTLCNYLIKTALLFISITTIAQSPLPDGFHNELVSDDWESPLGIEFIDSSHWLVWERTGKIWHIADGVPQPEPVLDLSLEVMSSAEHGLLSMLVDPDFARNGHIYLAYVVDAWVLRHPNSTPDISATLEEWTATIGRVTRYAIDLSTWQTVDSSRKVLLGKTIDSGIPILSPSHGIGGMSWGADTTLILGTGDGTTWVGAHSGGEDYQKFGYDSLGKVDGIISADEDLGSYRAQYVNSYSGKILRFDRQTGLGIPSNPFYRVDEPDAPASKVWSLGFRNPFRLVRKPGTGSSDPSLGDPGVLYVGDVGRYFYEEINVIDGPGSNCGWPVYEGFHGLEDYQQQEVLHPLADTTLSFSCPKIFQFDSLLRRDHRSHHNQVLACDDHTLTFYEEIPVTTHHVPMVAYGNSKNAPDETYLPSYNDGGWQDFRLITDPSAGVDANPFDGISSIAGTFGGPSSWPEPYRDRYYHADFGGWIKMLDIDEHQGGELHNILPFVDDDRPIVFLKFNPYDDCLYYVVLNYQSDNPQELRRICFGGTPAPIAKIETDIDHGASPITFRLDGSRSEGNIAEYLWLADGDSIGDQPQLELSYSAPPDSISTKSVVLLVRDSSGQSAKDSVLLHINNSPPSVTIRSPINDLHYDPEGELLQLQFQADVTDQEHVDNQLSYRWSLFLNHNSHTHLEWVDTMRQPQLQWQTVPESPFATYSYSIALEVEDPLGLCARDEVVLKPAVTTSIDELAPQIVVFPNPLLGGELRVRSTAPIASIQLVSSVGEKMRLWNDVEQDSRLDVSSLSSGVYFLMIRLQDGGVVWTKIVVGGF